jgi:hypothetical protein
MSDYAVLTRALAVAALILACSATARAAPAPKSVPDLPQITAGESAVADFAALMGGKAEITKTGDSDEDAVLAARRDVDKNGILAVGPRVDALKAVLAHMPNPFTRTRVVNGMTYYRADSDEECDAHTPAGRPKSFVCKGNPFAVAGFYLGSYYNEIGKPNEALTALDAGLTAAPNAPLMLAERCAADWGSQIYRHSCAARFCEKKAMR